MATPLLKVTIDDIVYEIPSGLTVIQACDMIGVEIPRFCYHSKLEIAGNCRMCLVESITPKSPKPIASCATNVAEGMVISTKSTMVKKAREGVMEFLLINHPLDCPICDQGGECDLQDQAYAYGSDRSRYREEKRAVEDKNFGPLIKTNMTRCIHCTRCARFLEDIAGTTEIGTFGRGENMEINTFLEKNIKSELSGNIIDLCPVGALTSKPYAFKARSWELQKTDSIDVMDAVGSNIRVDSRGMEVMRILPRMNNSINQEWLGDKSRFAYDGLKLQRLDRVYIKKDNELIATSLNIALKTAAAVIKNVNPSEIAALAGDMTDIETAFALKTLLDNLGCHQYECRQDGAQINIEKRGNYLFNTKITSIKQATSALLIGTYPRWEAPIINLTLREAVIKHGLKVANIGLPRDLSYPVEELGNDLAILNGIYNGDHEYAEVLSSSVFPMLIVGQGALKGPYGIKIQELCLAIAHKYNLIREDWNGYNMLHTAAGRVGCLDVGFYNKKDWGGAQSIINSCQSGKIKVLICLGCDEVERIDSLKDTYIIYLGTHGDILAPKANIILPAACYTEKNASYANTEGLIQSTNQAVPTIGEAVEDYFMVLKLAEALQVPLPYQNRDELLNLLARQNPIFRYDNYSLSSVDAQGADAISEVKTVSKLPPGLRVNYNINNYYMTDYISRNSPTMAKCSMELVA